MTVTYTKRWTTPSDKTTQVDTKPQETETDSSIANLSAEGLDPATMTFFWISPDGAFIQASDDIMGVGDNQDDQARVLTIKHCRNHNPAANPFVEEDYDVVGGTVLSKSTRKTLLPEDILLGVDSDVVTSPVGEYLRTIFKECDKEVTWFTPWTRAVVRLVEVKGGPIRTGGAGPTMVETRPSSPHVGFILGNKEGLDKVIGAIESIRSLKIKHPTIESLRGTEQQVTFPEWTLGPPPADAPKNMIAHLQPAKGSCITVVIPTENKHKVATIQAYFHKRVPMSTVVHFDIVPVQSDVGEQPYNSAGCRGAWNRIGNALDFITNCEELVAVHASRQAGQVYVAAIENFIQTEGFERPADLGVVALYNVLKNTVTSTLTKGVTIDPAFVDAAKRYGCEAKDDNYGQVTVGNVIAARFPGVDKANWHELVAGVSRYDLLAGAIESLELP